MQKRIVIADDDPTTRGSLEGALRAAGFEAVQCQNGEDAEKAIKKGGVDLVISDVRMPGVDGLELLRRCQAVSPAPPFIMISGYASVSEAVEAMKMGAYDFVVKPFSYRELMSLVGAALRRREEGETEKEGTGEVITFHPRMLALLKFAAQVAKSQASVLIQGESGTGKELLAMFIHARSRRSSGPFVAVNCAALPEGLLESELFGHERGAFTGAVVSKPGKFELADNGTLLLDEVSEMSLPLQAKLLRALQEREVDRVGGRKPLSIDIRVIATTNRDLRERISAEIFREDLFYRLNVIPLRLPPLRDRVCDIEPLARSFFIRNGQRGTTLSPESASRLKSHSWRGNVRELFNVLERATILAAGGVIKPEHLLLEGDISSLLSTPSPLPVRPEEGDETVNQPNDQSDHTDEINHTIRAGLSVQEMEEMLIRKTLTEVQNNRTQAAKLLGISVRTLRNKLKLYKKEAVGNQQSVVS